jgi:hypothetical protein
MATYENSNNSLHTFARQQKLISLGRFAKIRFADISFRTVAHGAARWVACPTSSPQLPPPLGLAWAGKPCQKAARWPTRQQELVRSARVQTAKTWMNARQGWFPGCLLDEDDPRAPCWPGVKPSHSLEAWRSRIATRIATTATILARLNFSTPRFLSQSLSNSLPPPRSLSSP